MNKTNNVIQFSKVHIIIIKSFNDNNNNDNENENAFIKRIFHMYMFKCAVNILYTKTPGASCPTLCE